MKSKHPQPLYWGAFICQGDPAPLTRRDPSPNNVESLNERVQLW